MSDEGRSATGLTPAEAKEFHSYYMMGTYAFTALTIVAHILIWMWRPWF